MNKECRGQRDNDEKSEGVGWMASYKSPLSCLLSELAAGQGE